MGTGLGDTSDPGGASLKLLPLPSLLLPQPATGNSMAPANSAEITPRRVERDINDQRRHDGHARIISDIVPLLIGRYEGWYRPKLRLATRRDTRLSTSLQSALRFKLEIAGTVANANLIHRSLPSRFLPIQANVQVVGCWKSNNPRENSLHPARGDCETEILPATIHAFDFSG